MPLTEPLFSVLTLACVVVMLPTMKRIVWWRIGLGGLLAGLACLVRPQLLPVPAFLGLWWIWPLRWRAIPATLAFTVAMWIPIAPWTVRNYVVTGTFIPVQTDFGQHFWK